MNSRTILFGLILAAAVMVPAAADQRGDLLNAMNKCVAIADDKARLACYDALKPQLQAALAEPAEQVAKEEGTSWFGLDHIFGGKDAPQTEPNQFGADRLPAEEQAKTNPPPPPEATPVKELDSMTATLTDYALTPTGRFIVFLDNGQVWQEIEGDTATAHFKKNPKENTVTITRALLGSYALTINDLNQSYKVKRMK
jgi:hypothetical protein